MKGLDVDALERQKKSAASLPLPSRPRWQPLRSGILNLYRFDQEEFWYEQGRLLLRGNNGTGKSRVLALQLPFLLDGEVAPHRVEPDRDPAKRMEWNLLLGKFHDRRGYTWVEFGRLSDGGEPQFTTFGCGLQAVEGRGITARWFFVTPQRVGCDFSLQTQNRQPLTRDQLAEQLGVLGKVFTTAQDYRREVDAVLFGLGEQRYEALVELLITLRQPQLARTLDEHALSRALGEALPPLSQRIIDDVAESMKGLEVDREQLESHRLAAQAIDSFLNSYRRYAQIASRRKAEVVRQTHAKFEATGRQLKATEAELEGAASECASFDKDLETLKVAEAESEAAQATLLASPQMATARELDGAKRYADECHAYAVRARSDAETAAAELTGARESLSEARRRVDEAHQESSHTASRAATHADSIGLRRTHDSALDDPALASSKNERLINVAKAAISKAIDARRDEVRRLRDLCSEADRAAAALAQAKQDRDRAACEADVAMNELNSATAQVGERVEEVISKYQRWREGLLELRPVPPGELALPMRDWVQAGPGENPLTSAVRVAAIAAMEQLARAEADLYTRIAAARTELDDLVSQRDCLLAGRHEPPAAPYTRPADGRVGRPGAPLWALCEFEESVPDIHRAGLEAALEASGLLDAWLLPSGDVVDADTNDCFLTAADADLSSVRANLRSVLRPSVDRTDPLNSAVDDTVVSSVLRAIGLGAGPDRVWVDVNGSWRNGALTGHWEKPVAEHLGGTARERYRQRRLRALGEEVDLAQQRLRALDDERVKLGERRRIAAAEEEAAPRDDAIRNALAAEAQTRRVLAEARTRLTQAEARSRQAHGVCDAAAAKRDEAARDFGLAAWITRLDQLDEAITRYREAVGDVWLALRQHADALVRAEREELRIREAERKTAEHRERVQQALQRAQAAQTRFQTLEQTQGAAVKEVMVRLEDMKRELARIRSRKDEAIDRRTRSTAQVARLEERIVDLRTQRAQHERDRDEAVGGYRRFVATGLMGIGDTARRSIDIGDWSTTRLVELARESEQALVNVNADDAAWERQQNQVFEQFKSLEDALLHHGHRPEMRRDGDVFVIRATFQGRPCAIDELFSALEDEVGQRQMLLDAREREIIENHLIGEVAQHLHDRLRQADQHVRDMNAELARVPTSSGMVLRFRWEPRDDGPVGLADARRRLLGAVGTWSAEEREAVGRFLQERIKVERVANDTGTWQEQLSAALDYRAWHDFVIERNIDGNWRRLTRRTHGTASGGEKAIALMIPMFAAAASHYRSAAPTAPRLILLDEAFVGVDTEMRAKCMGLLRAFDLDFIMTSEREWCCYATLPGVAICQLSARPGVDGVYVSRWVWNGRDRVQAFLNNGEGAAAPSLPTTARESVEARTANP